MSESNRTEPKPNSARRATADKAILAYVERWMALVRELSLEQAAS
jgi:hypothetical protein